MKHLGSTLETPAVALAGSDLAGTLAMFVVVVSHGSNASTARPAGAPLVYWKGSVEPNNALAGDLWYDTSGD